MIFLRRICSAENQKNGAGDTALIEEAQPQAEGSELQAEATQGGTLLAETDAGTELAEIDSWDSGEEAGMENPGRQCSPAALRFPIT